MEDVGGGNYQKWRRREGEWEVKVKGLRCSQLTFWGERSGQNGSRVVG